MTLVKAAIFDGWACFGSANYDDLSLHKNYELNITTFDKNFVKCLENKVLIDGQKKSKEIFKPVKVGFLDHLFSNLADFA
jgi:phosphatidylserine/phosphatidylglycerophosphate/cardiolipin synthase-like enzyme